MKTYIAAALLGVLLAGSGATAAARKPCAELRDEIAAKLDAKGVANYSLDVVAPGDVGEAQVVGSCDGGTQRITYRRAAAPAAVAEADAGATRE